MFPLKERVNYSGFSGKSIIYLPIDSDSESIGLKTMIYSEFQNKSLFLTAGLNMSLYIFNEMFFTNNFLQQSQLLKIMIFSESAYQDESNNIYFFPLNFTKNLACLYVGNI